MKNNCSQTFAETHEETPVSESRVMTPQGLRELPCEVEINGKIYPFSTDFYDWMRFETLMLDEDVPVAMKSDIAVKMLFEEMPPADVSKFLLWFWRCGAEKKKTKVTAEGFRSRSKRSKNVYSFEYDAPLIFAAFYQQYGIDLTTVKMHWWKFRALFDALTEDTKFVKVMGYRSIDLKDSGMPADRLKHYKNLQEIYKLPRSLSEQQKINKMKRLLERGD